jgi:hypothetical protein
VRHISAFRSFSGFIIALRNIPEKFSKKSSGNVIIYQYCYCIVIMFFKYNYFLCLIFSIICIPRSTEVFIIFLTLHKRLCSDILQIFSTEILLQTCYPQSPSFVGEPFTFFTLIHKAVNKTFRSYSVTTVILVQLYMHFIQSKSVGQTIFLRVNPSVRAISLIKGKLRYNYCVGVIILLRVIHMIYM